MPSTATRPTSPGGGSAAACTQRARSSHTTAARHSPAAQRRVKDHDFGHGFARHLYLLETVRYRETSRSRHRPFGGYGCGPRPELELRSNPGETRPLRGPSSCQGVIRTAMDLSICPAAYTEPWCSHRQRQNLLLGPLVEFANKMSEAHVPADDVGEVGGALHSESLMVTLDKLCDG